MMTIQILFDIIYNKGESSKRKLVEYGGRPTFYLYSKFMNGGRIDDWLGSTTCFAIPTNSSGIRTEKL